VNSTSHSIFSGLAATLLLAFIASGASAQDVIHHSDAAEPFEERWEWASPASREPCSDGCWIGYGIRRLMAANSHIGSSGNGQRATLQALVYGREVEPLPSRSNGDTQPAAGPSEVMKEIAILFRYESGTLREIDISNISLPVDLEGLPLFWLGIADPSQSIQVLRDEYASTRSTEVKEDLVSAVGIHDADDLVVPFLTEVLESSVHDDVREQSVFWLTEAQHDDALPLLERTARGDDSEDVRDQAVFGVSRIESDEADELLIRLARELEEPETREQAIFWLGQKASARAAESLGDIAENDPDLEIQKKAVFALSQLPTDDGIPRLIRIARTHRSAEVRHDAIFWLGESGDDRAVDELVRIVRGQ